MKLPSIQKRVIIRNTIICTILVCFGWYLNSRLSPQMPMGMGMRGEPFVLVRKIETMDIAPAKTFIGHVEPIESVDIKPRVTGYIDKILFEEGSLVKKDDVLFIIEQKQYIANVKLREAELAKAKAVFKQVKRDYERQKSLNQQRFVSEAALEKAESDYLQAQASIKQAEANLDLAKIDLQYTEIRSPINGIVGKALITEGNIVNATSQTLARIVQMNPIRIAFSMTDKDFLGFRKADVANQLENFRTELVLSDGTVVNNNFFSKFTDNEVNRETSTIAIFAEFANDKQFLIPGSYIRVKIRPKAEQRALLVPQVSISQDEFGNYVFVVNKDGIAEQRRVVLGDTIEDRQIVRSGLEDNEIVIIQGIQKVSNGVKVNAQLIGIEAKEGE